MKSKILTIAFVSAALLSTVACKKPEDAAKDFVGSLPVPNAPATAGAGADKLPAYKTSVIAGNLFGLVWDGYVAVAHQDPSKKDVTVTILEDRFNQDPCTYSSSEAFPFVTAVLPTVNTNDEFVTDAAAMQYQSPVVMINPKVYPPLNLMADKSKVRVGVVTGSDFELSVYATGVGEDGHTSEINGKILVQKCQ